MIFARKKTGSKKHQQTVVSAVETRQTAHIENTAFGRFCLGLLVLLAGFSIASSATELPDEVAEQYRMLSWQDLVPEGWEAPLILPAYGDRPSAEIDEESVVTDLDGQLSVLPGYMKPVVFEDNRVSEFVLVPYLPHQSKRHAPLFPNQMVYVYAVEPIVVEHPYEPIWSIGTMLQQPVMTQQGPAAYRMVGAVTTRYEY